MRSGHWMIIALDEYDDQGNRLYWSNNDGWTARGKGDAYYDLIDIATLTLPQGGAWVPA